MKITLKQVELRKVDITTRMPFRYGIATLTAVPYLIVFGDFEVDGQPARGVSADILPPKWFTKQPGALIEDEIAEMLLVIQAACRSALEVGEQESVFHWWKELNHLQVTNSALQEMPALLKGFGVSLLERAAIDATCQKWSTTFHEAIRRNLLGIELDAFHPELAGGEPANFLPSKPTAAISIRHTVGLSDPLTDDEIRPEDRLEDGLPQSLSNCVEYYGINYFKIKVPAQIDEALDRLRRIDRLVRCRKIPFHFTLDGNEFYTDPDEFRQFWNQLRQDEQIRAFLEDGLLVVEQPLHRDVALSEQSRQVLCNWEGRPPIIIDESDGEMDSLRQALQAGYAGTSHKNCKGVIKGLANACLLNHLNEQSGKSSYICTGEDLMNVGPVALQQDLAVGAAIGLTHVERNGHHYVAGLEQMPPNVQREVLEHHSDSYREHKTKHRRFPTLSIEQGRVDLRSVNLAPFGYAIDLDAKQFELITGF